MDISLQNATVRSLANGIKLYILSSEEFEVLRVSFVFGAGSVHQSKAFTASATANMLCEGSHTMNSQQIAEKLDYYGSYYDVNIDRDYTYISFCSLTKFVEQTLSVAEQIILHPTFPEEELTTYRAKRKQRLAIERQRIEIKAREEFAKSLFGETHPYGIAADANAYDTLTREDIVEFHARHYIAENSFVVCSGRVGEEEIRQIERLAAAIPSGEALPELEFPQIIQRPYLFVEQPDAVQSSIRIGRRLFTRSHPDFLGMQVVSTILGGYFGSRLMQSLREERGYTYGVVAAMVNFAREGYFAIATQVGTEVCDDALKVIFEQIETLRNELMPQEELEMVKMIMTGEIMRILDGPFGVADVTIENILCGDTNEIIEQNLRIIEAFTCEEIQHLAQTYLDPKDMITIVAGAKA